MAAKGTVAAVAPRRTLAPAEAERLAGALLGLVGLGFSAYLTYLELFVINAICQWCVASAVVMTALTAVLIIRLLREPHPGADAPA